MCLYVGMYIEAYARGFFPLVYNSYKALQKASSMERKILPQLFMLQCLHL